MIHQRISVAWDYPVIFTHAIFAAQNPILRETLDRLGEARRHRALIFLDAEVAAAHPLLAEQATAYFAAFPRELELAAPPILTPAGEAVKNDWARLEGFIRQMLAAHLDRHSFVVMVGGGALLDAVGLAAALVHRGLRQVRLPTTVLGQNDAGIGVKNGVNFAGGKNALGTFAPPFAVLNDFDFLETLPDSAWLAGVAEAFKVAIIRDRVFFEELRANAGRYAARDSAAIQALIRRCAELHLEHLRTGGDPFEMGRARPLDFGHWSAHKLELLTSFRLSHGEAVAIGVLLDCTYAARKAWISSGELAEIRDALSRCGFRLWHEALARRDAAGALAIFGGLRDFQEHLGGELTVTFPRKLGASHEVHEIDLALMESCLHELSEFARSS